MRRVHVVIDRPLGSVHPQYKDTVYEVNYGYVPDILGGDGEAQDAYILGVENKNKAKPNLNYGSTINGSITSGELHNPLLQSSSSVKQGSHVKN